MFDARIGLKSSCTAVLNALSNNDAFDVSDKLYSLSIPLYQAVLYALAIEAETWHLYRTEGEKKGDVNDIAFCIASFEGDIENNREETWTLNMLKKVWPNSVVYLEWKKKFPDDSGLDRGIFDKSGDDYHAHQLNLMKRVRHAVVHAHVKEISEYQDLFWNSGVDHYQDTVWFFATLILQVCYLNNKLHPNRNNSDTLEYVEAFYRKFLFWRGY